MTLPVTNPCRSKAACKGNMDKHNWVMGNIKNLENFRCTDDIEKYFHAFMNICGSIFVN